MLAIVEEQRAAIAEICRHFGVGKLELFGSAATGAFDANRSDLDFIVEFPPGLTSAHGFRGLATLSGRSRESLTGASMSPLLRPSAIRGSRAKRTKLALH